MWIIFLEDERDLRHRTPEVMHDVDNPVLRAVLRLHRFPDVRDARPELRRGFGVIDEETNGVVWGLVEHKQFGICQASSVGFRT